MVDLSPYLNRRPIRVETLGRFYGPDPWRNGAPTEWAISQFELVQKAFAANREWALARPQDGGQRLPIQVSLMPRAFGLETAQGEWRLLPRPLARLWQSGNLPHDMLPALLHRIEPHLRRIDVRPLPTFRRLVNLSATAAVLILAVLVVVMSLVPEPGRAVSDVKLSAWLTAPFKTESVNFDDTLMITGRTPVPPTLRFPADLYVPFEPNRVGWIKAQGESRLVLYREFHTDGDKASRGGTVLPVADAGIGPDVLAAVRARVSDINTSLVMVDMSNWVHRGLFNLDPFVLFMVLCAVCPIIAIIVGLLAWSFRAFLRDRLLSTQIHKELRLLENAHRIRHR